jgi:hypothetical protein
MPYLGEDWLSVDTIYTFIYLAPVDWSEAIPVFKNYNLFL